ncbi:bombesin receptor-activated protein C6orf89 homolog isoform X1 [Acanthopagrus latus]|uniref:bombesin receptor-activated protein C6orf89 homolog isoform X1 n=3 Tax=cellular organisms TaxID=131567 RepID=UPI00187C5B46|nr:bombesin receptor-activated protein C6orf89 homolog isoform X1 [Acanthopagrus latus]
MKLDGGYAPIRNSRIEEEEDEEEEEEEEEETLSGAVLSSHANYLASHFFKLKYRFSVELNVRQKGPRYSGGCHLMVTPCSWSPHQLKSDVFDQQAAVMGTTMSEPCIYDKLSESIDILRQSGYRYGMSEREIEKFIKQVLETNEPRREPPQFPLLRATIKFVVAVGFLLLAVLAFTYPQSAPQLGLVNLGCYNWSSPLSHVRLLSLPIAKKYNLQGFHEWWSAGSLRQNLVNCSGCAEISSVLEVPESLRGTVTLRRGPQLVLLKGGESLSVQRQQLEELYLAHSGSMSILLEEDDGLQNHNLGLPQGPANFTLLWRFSSGTREKVLRWLFPKAELCPLLDSAGTIVQRCLVTHSTNSQSKGVGVFGWLVVGEGLPTVRVLPVQRCQKHCSSFNLWLTPGDMVYADPRYWQMELFPGRGQNIICDGSAF